MYCSADEKKQLTMPKYTSTITTEKKDSKHQITVCPKLLLRITPLPSHGFGGRRLEHRCKGKKWVGKKPKEFKCEDQDVVEIMSRSRL